jgi:hypothetical protein
MGCSKSSTVEPIAISAYSYKSVSKKLCVFCKTRQGTFHLLECNCWICHNCTIQTLESFLKYGNSSAQKIGCPKCKKNVNIKELSLGCGCTINPFDLALDNQDSSVCFNFDKSVEQCKLSVN